MQKFFHVSSVDHPVETVLKPGQFGAASRAARVRQTIVQTQDLSNIAWESALEVARRCLAPNAPSRLDCVFATPTQQEAVQFRQRFRTGAFLFEISVAGSVPVHVADFESITTTIEGRPFLDTYVDAAMLYWTHGQQSTLREVIVGGDATISRKLP